MENNEFKSNEFFISKEEAKRVLLKQQAEYEDSIKEKQEEELNFILTSLLKLRISEDYFVEKNGVTFCIRGNTELTKKYKNKLFDMVINYGWGKAEYTITSSLHGISHLITLYWK